MGEKEPKGKPTSVRLPELEFNQISALAMIDGLKFSEELRRAVTWYIESRFADPEIHEQIEAAHQRISAAFASLTQEVVEVEQL